MVLRVSQMRMRASSGSAATICAVRLATPLMRWMKFSATRSALSIGLAGPLMPRNLFANARWSTEHALLDTLVSLHGKRVALTETLSDVDIIDDLAPGAIHATPLSIHETGVSP